MCGAGTQRQEMFTTWKRYDDFSRKTVETHNRFTAQKGGETFLSWKQVLLQSGNEACAQLRIICIHYLLILSQKIYSLILPMENAILINFIWSDWPLDFTSLTTEFSKQLDKKKLTASSPKWIVIVRTHKQSISALCAASALLWPFGMRGLLPVA